MQSEVFQCNFRGEKLWRMEVHTAGSVECFDSDGDYAVGGNSAGSIVFWKLHKKAGTEKVFMPCGCTRRASRVSQLAVPAHCSFRVLVTGACVGPLLRVCGRL